MLRQPKPAASAAAPPPVDPPGVRVRSHGLLVVPWIGLWLCQSLSMTGTFVFPTTMAPADSRRSTATAVRGLCAAASAGRPQVFGDPLYANASLIVTGTP